jgi:hypothetical protein
VDLADPLRRIKKLEVEWWPGAEKAAGDAAGKSQRQAILLPARPGVVQAELTLPPLPQGQGLGVQLVYHAGQERRTVPITIQPSAPAERKPLELALNPRSGQKATLEFASAGTFKVSAARGLELPIDVQVRAGLQEALRSVDARGEANFRLDFPRFTMSMSLNNMPIEDDKLRLSVLAAHVRRMAATAYTDKQGNIVRTDTDFRRLPSLPHPGSGHAKDYLLQNLELTAIPLPGGRITPGQVWRAKRVVKFDALGLFQEEQNVADLAFTYLGTRRRNDREEAILGIQGSVSNNDGDATGHVAGAALVDVDSGQPLLVRMAIDLETEVQTRGIPGETRSVPGNAVGTIELRLEREVN